MSKKITNKLLNRRNFLKLFSAPIVAGPLSVFASSNVNKTDERAGDYVGFIYDSTKCIGCQVCTNACIKVNVLPEETKGLKKYVQKPDFSKATHLTKIDVYNDKKTNKPVFIKNQCLQCLHPSCVSACPTSAMEKDKKTGIISNNPDKCIGCRYCMIACPYNALRFEWDKTFPRIVKCTMCKDTYLKKKKTTACVEACPTGALVFGKRRELLKIAKERIRKYPQKYINKVYGEKDGGGTAVLYLSGTDLVKAGFVPERLGDESVAKVSEDAQVTFYGLIGPVLLYTAAAVYKNFKENHDEEEG